VIDPDQNHILAAVEHPENERLDEKLSLLKQVLEMRLVACLRCPNTFLSHVLGKRAIRSPDPLIGDRGFPKGAQACKSRRPHPRRHVSV